MYPVLCGCEGISRSDEAKSRRIYGSPLSPLSFLVIAAGVARFPSYLNRMWRSSLWDLDQNMRKKWKPDQKHWLFGSRFRPLVLDKHMKLKRQARLLPRVISEPKQSDPRRFAPHLAPFVRLQQVASVRRIYSWVFSGSAQTHQVLWSKHRGVTVPPVWLSHDRESRLDLSPATCDMFAESLLLRCFKSLTSWKAMKAGQIFAFHLLYLKRKHTPSFHYGTQFNCFPSHYNMYFWSGMDDGCSDT